MTAVALTVLNDEHPCPRVGVTLGDLHPSAPSLVTVWRTADGHRSAVRGGVRRSVIGGDYLVDFEVPLGRDVQYSMELIQGEDEPADDRPVVNLPALVGWAQDPLNPRSAVRLSGGDPSNSSVELMPDAFSALTYKLNREMVPIMGSRFPAILGGRRLAAAGVDFSVMTATAEQATAMHNLLMEADPILVRPLPEWGSGLEPLLYLSVEDAQRLPVRHGLGGTLTRWRLVGDSAQSPALDVVVPLWTYGDVAELWETYQEAQDAADGASATYLNELQSPTFEGV